MGKEDAIPHISDFLGTLDYIVLKQIKQNSYTVGAETSTRSLNVKNA